VPPHQGCEGDLVWPGLEALQQLAVGRFAAFAAVTEWRSQLDAFDLSLGHVPDVLNALSIPVEPAIRPAPSVFLQKPLSVAGDLWICTKGERSRRINAAPEAIVNKGVLCLGLAPEEMHEAPERILPQVAENMEPSG
jgi:hypothetical protein